jgi:hypothetical protein
MIAKKIGKKTDVADNYTQLALYIAAASEKGEKLDRFWIANCGAGEHLADLDPALAEVEAARKLRATVKDKTYHLVVSFRPGDQAKLDDAALKDIAASFATALGYGEHHYVAGTHVNTDNFHMHIAFNKVHPLTLKAISPYKDFQKLEATSRAMERKYGLTVDKGMSDGRGMEGLSPAARDFEANTWTESFQTHVLKHKDALLDALATAGSWEEAHAALARFDMRATLRGAGMVFTDPKGRQAMKASALDRSCSKGALEKRFGVFAPPEWENGEDRAKKDKTPNRSPMALPRPTRARYRPRPLVRHPNTARLWRRYLTQKRVLPTPPSLAARVARNWKLFLMTEAYEDPLAFVLIMAHKEALGIVFGTQQQPNQALFRKPRTPDTVTTPTL